MSETNSETVVENLSLSERLDPHVLLSFPPATRDADGCCRIVDQVARGEGVTAGSPLESTRLAKFLDSLHDIRNSPAR